MSRRLLILAAIASLLSAHCARAMADGLNALTSQELAEGWILLFDGQTSFGWRSASKGGWKVADGTISVSKGEPGLLYTASQFGDFVLRVEFRSLPATKSGILLRILRQFPKIRCGLLRTEHC